MKEKPIIDDSAHDIMYISPGEHRGGYKRTFDWAPARTDAEVALLEKRGYSRTLEHAYAYADAVAEAKASKTEIPKFVPEAPGERDPISGDLLPAKVAKPAEESSAAPSGPTLAEVQGALKALKDAKDAKTVVALLKVFDAASALKLKPEHYAAVIADAAKAAKE